ncbi:right-handed parallel beta-helix repeat-containing protein [Nocardiopsis sp. B62]|uniref:right-handed parallel beta-helix repeat-containing protein n=1 Tax=Nocardiopsis sp. B62 TaxID=2824874 RepID=UPI001B358D6B|nr:right-handed parallel beta-helix repeat-containing protein [Nocardiopsis sp. B62]MBQ1080355.1 right-handed parallel beta-helix repeat-containing protein [Nocardiopsis sp. B62]
MPLPSYPPDLAGEWSLLHRRVRSTFTSSQRRGPVPGASAAAGPDGGGARRTMALPEEGAPAGVRDVRALGAVGDGRADDTGALQTALDRAREDGGGVVWVPGGTYSVQAPPLRVHANTRIVLAPDAVVRRDGEGTLLTNGDPGQESPGHAGHGRILLEGGVWDGNGLRIPAHDSVLSFGHALGITVRDTVIRDVPGHHAVELDAVRCARILDVRFEGFTDAGGARSLSEAVRLGTSGPGSGFDESGPHDDTPCSDVVLSGCSFGASQTPGSGPWPRGIGSRGATPGRSHGDIRILGCHFESCSAEAVHACAWDRLTVQGNTFLDCAGGVSVVSVADAEEDDTARLGGGDPTGHPRPLSDVVVTGNVLTGTGGLPAVRCAGHPGGPVRNVTVTGNTVSGTVGTGFLLESTEDAVVDANVLSGVGGTGVHVRGGGGLRVSGNRISGAAAYGIRASDRTNGLSVTGNGVDSRDSGLSVTGTCRNLVRHGNDLRGSGGLDDASPDPVTDPGDLV